MPRQDPGEPYYRVDSHEAKTILDAEPDNTVVIDVRRDDEWVTGHVSGAIHIPIDDLTDHMDEVPPGQEAAVHLRRRRAQRLGLRACRVHGIRPAKPVQHRGRHPALDRWQLPHQLRQQPLKPVGG